MGNREGYFGEYYDEKADEIAEEDFMQLDDSLRTVKSDIRIIFLLNPPDRNHWIVRRFFNLEPSEAEGFYRPVLKTYTRTTRYSFTPHTKTTKRTSRRARSRIMSAIGKRAPTITGI